MANCQLHYQALDLSSFSPIVGFQTIFRRGIPEQSQTVRTKLCPRLLPTFKAGLLSTHSFCFNINGELYGVYWNDNLEKSDQKNILSWRCHKFKRKRRYDKWNFAFFRLECERWQHLHRCFETLIVCQSLFVCSDTTLLELQTLLFSFFPKSVLLNWGCGLSTDAAYTRTFMVSY